MRKRKEFKDRQKQKEMAHRQKRNLKAQHNFENFSVFLDSARCRLHMELKDSHNRVLIAGFTKDENGESLLTIV